MVFSRRRVTCFTGKQYISVFYFFILQVHWSLSISRFTLFLPRSNKPDKFHIGCGDTVVSFSRVCLGLTASVGFAIIKGARERGGKPYVRDRSPQQLGPTTSAVTTVLMMTRETP